MNLDDVLAEIHRDIGSVAGDISGALARRKFKKSDLAVWWRKLEYAAQRIKRLEEIG